MKLKLLGILVCSSSLMVAMDAEQCAAVLGDYSSTHNPDTEHTRR